MANVSTVFCPELTRGAKAILSHHAGQGEFVLYEVLVRLFWLDEGLDDTEAKDAGSSVGLLTVLAGSAGSQ